MAHPFFLNFGLVIVLRIGLQHMLNDDGIDGNNCLFDTAKVEPEGIAMEFDVLRQNSYGIVRHGARVPEGLESGDGRYALRQGHASLSGSVWTAGSAEQFT